MIYKLEFLQSALKEWKKLDAGLKEQFKKKLAERLKSPRIESAKLSGLPDCYKIKLRSSGYRLVYQVIDKEIVVLVVALGKRNQNMVYSTAKNRL